jgi:predicted dehydrogenase
MLTRRQLGRGLLGAAVLPNSRIAVACLGTGWQGMNNVRSFLEEPLARVVAVCDVDRNHLEEARAAVNAKYGGADCLAIHEFEEALAGTASSQ